MIMGSILLRLGVNLSFLGLIINEVGGLSDVKIAKSTKKIIGIRKLYAVMASDVKIRKGEIDTMSILAFLRQDVA